MIDAVDPLLHLNHDAPIFWDSPREIGFIDQALCLLERRSAILEVARVELDGLLVGVNIEPDAGPGGV